MNMHTTPTTASREDAAMFLIHVVECAIHACYSNLALRGTETRIMSEEVYAKLVELSPVIANMLTETQAHLLILGVVNKLARQIPGCIHVEGRQPRSHRDAAAASAA